MGFTSPFPLAGEVGTKRRVGENFNGLFRSDTPTPALPRKRRKREREKKIGSRRAGSLPFTCDLLTTLRGHVANGSGD